MTAAALPPTAPARVLQRRYSVEEYLEIERKTNQKHIFINGLIYPIAGAKPPYLRISGNIFVQLYNALESRVDYEVFSSETKIYLSQFNYYYYPHALVVAGKPEFASKEIGAILNPILIVEVLSDSTAEFDKGQKFAEYKTLPSFREYVLIHQNKAQVNSHLLDSDGIWQPSVVSGLDSEVHFQSIDVKVSLSKIYRNVSFETVA